RAPAPRDRPLPHPGLLSAHRRHPLGGGRPARHHHGDAGLAHLRAGGTADRCRRGRLDGKEEAGGLFLMSALPAEAPPPLEGWLAEQTGKSLLRFLTCGSVDDGKSTLIGRLLYDSHQVLDDQLASLRADSRNRVTGGDGIDFSLLVDGLAAEREQGITI